MPHTAWQPHAYVPATHTHAVSNAPAPTTHAVSNASPAPPEGVSAPPRPHPAASVRLDPCVA